MAIIASTGKFRNVKESLWRVADACWFGRDTSTYEQVPAILNGEFITGVNAAGTGTVNIIGVDTSNRLVLGSALVKVVQAITASGAINSHASGVYSITKAGVAAMTLAAPTATTDDGETIVVSSTTAFAHTITATGLLQTGSASVNVATFAAFAGATVTLSAYQGKWIVLSSTGITFS